MERLLQHRSLESLTSGAENSVVLFMRRLHHSHASHSNSVDLLVSTVDSANVSTPALAAVLHAYGTSITTARLVKLYEWCARGRTPESMRDITLRMVDVLADQAMSGRFDATAVRSLLPTLATQQRGDELTLSLAYLYGATGDDDKVRVGNWRAIAVGVLRVLSGRVVALVFAMRCVCPSFMHFCEPCWRGYRLIPSVLFLWFFSLFLFVFSFSFFSFFPSIVLVGLPTSSLHVLYFLGFFPR